MMTKAKSSVSFFFLQREQKFLPNTTSGKGLSVSKIAKIQGVMIFDLTFKERLWKKTIPAVKKLRSYSAVMNISRGKQSNSPD